MQLLLENGQGHNNGGKRDGQVLNRDAKRSRKGSGKGNPKILGNSHGTTDSAPREDATHSLTMEMEFLCFAQQGPGGIIPTMVQLSAAWHAKTEGTRQASRSPLRMILATCLFKELEDRFSNKVIAKDQAGTRTLLRLRQELIKKQLISEDGTQWSRVQWSPEKEQLVATDGTKQTLQAANATITELRQMAQKPGLILRFHAVKSLTKVVARDGNQVKQIRIACMVSCKPSPTVGSPNSYL